MAKGKIENEKTWVTDNVVFENVSIIFRNFAGKESKYNREGNRNFCVLIEDNDFAEKLASDGWNVRILMPRDEDDDPKHYLQVSVGYNFNPPEVFLLTKRSKISLDEDTISTLDYADIKNVDLTIRPYNWEVGSKTGVKAYLKNMYVTINDDPLADKYSNWDYGTDDEEDKLPF